MNNDLQLAAEWFKANKLSLNISKTVGILFSKNATKIPGHLQIQIDNHKVQIKNSTKFLGVIIDKQLNWHEHIHNLKCKLNCSLYIMNRVKNILDKQNLKTLYYSMVQPYLVYGLTLWGGTHTTYVNKIGIQQKKALRIINKLPYNHHTNSHFYHNKILKLKDMYKLEIAKFMHRYNTKSLPSMLLNLFKTHAALHPYNTRNRNSPCIPLNKSLAAYNSILHQGPAIWQKLPNQIKSSRTISALKNRYSKVLVAKYSELKE